MIDLLALSDSNSPFNSSNICETSQLNEAPYLFFTQTQFTLSVFDLTFSQFSNSDATQKLSYRFIASVFIKFLLFFLCLWDFFYPHLYMYVWKSCKIKIISIIIYLYNHFFLYNLLCKNQFIFGYFSLKVV